MNLDEKDKALLNRIQDDIPLVNKPFAAIARELGMTEEEVLSSLKRLVDQGLIKKIRGLANPKKMGIKAHTLIGMQVPPERLDEVAEKINKFESVTHNYVRTHPRYNLWYVVEEKDEESLKKTNEMIRKATGITDTVDLPGLKIFKIDVRHKFE